MIKVDEYAIVSINDDRAHYKNALRDKIGSIKQARGISFIDGRSANIGALQYRYKIDDIWHTAKVGEIGVWFSFLNVCSYAKRHNKTILVFEDDAIITSDNFNDDLHRLLGQVPDDADAFSVLVPENQRATAHLEWISKDMGLAIKHTDVAPPYRVEGAHEICRAYQGYSFVSMVYTPKGAAEILRRVQITGMYTPADCWLFEQNDQGHLNVYTPTPHAATLVSVDWENQAPTTVHNSDRVFNLTE